MPNKKLIYLLIIFSILFWSIGFEIKAAPQITGVSPTEINVGDSVTISGSGFGANQDSSTVKFFVGPGDPSGWSNASSITSWSDTQIVAVAPTYAQTAAAAIKVTVGGNDAFSALTVKPKVTSVSASTNSVIVRFDNYMDGQPATNPSNYTLVSGGSTISLANAWSDFRGNQVAFRNISLTAGNSFTITVGAAVTSLPGTPVDSNFRSASGTVIAAPIITGISPSSGSIGDTITISGNNFGDSQGQSKVYFSAGPPTGGAPPQPVVATSYSSWSNTSISVVVPTGAKAGPIFVVVNGIESDFNPNAFFDIKGNFQCRILDSSNNPITNVCTNGRIVIGSITGPTLYYVGDSTGTTSCSDSDGLFTIYNVSSMGFAWAFDASGNHIVGSGQQIDIAQTVTFSLDGIAKKISGSISGANPNRDIVIFTDPIEETGTGMEWREPVFVHTDANGAATYNVGLGAAGKYIVGVEDPGFKTGTSSSPKIAPAAKEVDVTSANATNINFAFTAATARIHGKIQKAEGKSFTTGPGADVFHVFAYEPKENGLHASAMPNTTTLEFDLYVIPGVYMVEVGGPDVPFTAEEKIEVKAGDSNFALTDSTTDITLIIKAPEDYIEGTVKDSGGNGISGASIFAWSETGPGSGQAFTDSNGYYKMYLSPGTYSIEGFTPQYGKLTRRTGIVVSSSLHPTVDFSVSSEMATISGTVTKGGSALADADVWITEGQFGFGINGTRTNTSGQYSLSVPYASAGTYWLHVARPGMGELYVGQINSVLDKDHTTLTQDVSVNTATITVKISPKSSFSQAFVGIHRTGTPMGGFSETDISASGDTFRKYSIEVPKPASGSYTYIVEGGIPNYGPLPTTMTVDGTSQSNNNITVLSTTTTMTIEISLGTVYTISGTIADPDSSTTGNQAEGAWVWAASPTSHGGGEVDADGNFSFKVMAGTYDIGIDKPGYVGTMITGADVTAGNYAVASGALTLTSAGSTISGTVSSSSGTISGAWVWAANGTGGWAGAKTNGDGQFSLTVGSGNWTIRAIAEGYSESSPLTVSAGTTGVSITLTATSGYTATAPKIEPITPKDGGVIQGENVKFEAPAGALGTDTSSGSLTIEATTNLPSTNSFKPLGGKGKEITALDSSNTKITTLQSNVTIEMTYTAADLSTAGITQTAALDLSLGYWNSTTDTWVAIPTVAVPDSAGTGVTYKGTTNHLSDFAPLQPSGGTPPSTPTGLTATAGNQQVTLSWNASTGATKYYIYRYRASDGTYPYLGQTTSTSYTDTGLTNGTIYTYKVSALNADNDESAASDEVSATPTGGGGGGIFLGDTTPAAISDIKVSAGANSANITWKTNESSISWIVYGKTTDYGQEIKTETYTTSHSLSLSDLSPSTTYHYQIKSKDIAGNIGTYTDKTFTTLAVGEVPQVPAEELEGITIPTLEKPISQMTIAELQAKIAEFQAVIVKLQELLAKLKTPTEISGIPAGYKFEKTLKPGDVSEDVRYLQIFLNSDPDTRLAETGPGSAGNETTRFGSLTKAAVIKFQEKYAQEILAPWGLTKGTGIVGEKTRAKINQLLVKH